MVGLSKKRVFPKTKGDSITGQDRAQKHCDFRFSQIEKKSKVAVLQLVTGTQVAIAKTHYIKNLAVLKADENYTHSSFDRLCFCLLCADFFDLAIGLINP